MTHELAKSALRQAASQQDRQEAVKTALQLGMPLHEIEEYLDWIDLEPCSAKVADASSTHTAAEPAGSPHFSFVAALRRLVHFSHWRSSSHR